MYLVDFAPPVMITSAEGVGKLIGYQTPDAGVVALCVSNHVRNVP